METTSIIVELLIIGFFTLVWMLLFCVRVSLIDIKNLEQLLPFLQSTSGFLVMSGLSYQLGLVMNGISHRLTKRIGQTKFRNGIAPGKSYEVIKTKVHQLASEEMNRTLTLHLSFVRLTRAGMINFALIAILLFTFPWRIAVIGLVSLFISLLSFIGWRGAYRDYYRRIAYAYQEVSKEAIDESLFKEQ
jgi:hypothetical protein